ncbi:hypothetical protein ACZ90_70300 [Streptomyces albus subsp. albus]|nr:hypothetical protein ACZ90_70300 [Streptomyces albus subsp. albus]
MSQPSITWGRYCSILSLRFTVRVIWPRWAAERLPIAFGQGSHAYLRVQVGCVGGGSWKTVSQSAFAAMNSRSGAVR